MTDIEVGRYALRTFSLDYNWHRADLWFDDHDALYRYPYAILGPLNNMGGITSWEDGTCTAECLRQQFHIGIWDASKGKSFIPAPPGHKAPHKACTCGIYGSLTYTCLHDQYSYYMRNITAVIAAEGTTIIGTRGLRTQYARVVAWESRNDLYTEIAKEQFKDAQQYKDVCRMCADYHLPLGESPQKSGGGYAWWS